MKYGILKRWNPDQMKKVINELLWGRSLAKVDTNNKVCLFYKTIQNILSNFIPHEIIILMTEIYLG